MSATSSKNEGRKIWSNAVHAAAVGFCHVTNAVETATQLMLKMGKPDRAISVAEEIIPGNARHVMEADMIMKQVTKGSLMTRGC
jgi:hypothetical protein